MFVSKGKYRSKWNQLIFPHRGHILFPYWGRANADAGRDLVQKKSTKCRAYASSWQVLHFFSPALGTFLIFSEQGETGFLDTGNNNVYPDELNDLLFGSDSFIGLSETDTIDV